MGPRVANIGPLGQRRRFMLGVIALAAGLALATALVVAGAAVAWVAAVWPLFWIGALGVLQAREKT